MKERPILFSAPMVRALLDGSKTQTRRVCKSQPYANGFKFDGHDILCHNDYLPPSAMLMDVKRGPHRYTTSDAEGWEVECPYGHPGERLWVRETFMHEPADYCWEASVSIPCRPAETAYRADHPVSQPGEGWKPSIHMPRALSRIDLEVTGVRVERLQDISGSDALAEGIRLHPDHHHRPSTSNYGPVQTYRDLWEDINGAGSWALNPWVWVVEFRRIKP